MQRKRQTDKQTKRQTDRHTERQSIRQRDKKGSGGETYLLTANGAAVLHGAFLLVAGAFENAALVADAVRLRQPHVPTSVERQPPQREGTVDEAQLATG